jgi:COP9 signalosome complex subunit 6
MIAINYVAKGAGNAATSGSGEQAVSPGAAERAEKKGKKKADASLDTEASITDGTKESSSILTPEEEDQIAGLTTRLNSVRMLQSRLSLLSKFLQQQKPSYLSDLSLPLTASAPHPDQLPHLRNIQALLTRLNLLTPKASATTADTLLSASATTADTLLLASHAQNNDVQLSQLLALLGEDIQNMGEMGRKFAAVESAKQNKKGAKGGSFMTGHGQTDSYGHEMDWHQDPRREGGYSMAPF